jgi:hypothetical protein
MHTFHIFVQNRALSTPTKKDWFAALLCAGATAVYSILFQPYYLKYLQNYWAIAQNTSGPFNNIFAVPPLFYLRWRNLRTDHVLLSIHSKELSKLWHEDPTVWLFHGRIPDDNSVLWDLRILAWRWKKKNCDYLVGESLYILNTRISQDEGCMEDPRFWLFLGRSLYGWRREDQEPRLWLYGGRISPDCCKRIQDNYSVGESLRIVAGGFKIFIILWENLSRLWCGGFKTVINWWEDLSGLWREDPRLSLFGG